MYICKSGQTNKVVVRLDLNLCVYFIYSNLILSNLVSWYRNGDCSWKSRLIKCFLCINELSNGALGITPSVANHSITQNMRQLLPPATFRIGLYVTNSHLNVKFHSSYVGLHISTLSVFIDVHCGETRQPFHRWIFGIWMSSYNIIDDPLDLSGCGGMEGRNNPLFLVLSNANFTHYCENRRDTADITEDTDELKCLSVPRYFVKMNCSRKACSFNWNVQTQFNDVQLSNLCILCFVS